MDPCLSRGLKREVKLQQLHQGFELETPIPISVKTTVTLSATLSKDSLYVSGSYETGILSKKFERNIICHHEKTYITSS